MFSLLLRPLGLQLPVPQLAVPLVLLVPVLARADLGSQESNMTVTKYSITQNGIT